jgi:serine/threonine protein kinase
MSLESSSRLVKDYLLKVLISEGESTRTWLAEQISISRPAIVTQLKEERLDCKETFLAEARAKAAVDHPLIASVYEAASDDEGIFYAMELLPGCSLERYIVEGQTMAIPQITSMLRRIAKSQMYLESLDQATLPISAADIFLDDMGVTRIANLAQPGPRKPEQSSADLNQLGFFLKYLPTPGQPGTTRLLTLLSWMRGEDPGLALTWQQVVDLCHQIDEQLLKQQSEAQTIPNDPSSKNPLRRPVILIASVIAVVAASVLVLMMRPAAPKPDAAPPPTGGRKHSCRNLQKS